KDYWQVSVSNDGGTTFVPLENCIVADHSWRRFAFRVADYLTPTANMRLKFIAEDANDGSLVEALLDDIEIWSAEPVGIAETPILSWYAYPNPANEQLNFGWKGNGATVDVKLFNTVGQIVYQHQFSGNTVSETVSLKGMAEGIYTLQMSGENIFKSQKISVIH
ncbi:MAG TPA: T9SS type A sorting domain-containing protein, partial [Bacteroidia bacterium]|nr:T9SS type A sorting domain-containing protein [Bacteroidia bacterium]